MTSVPHILELSPADKRKFFASFDLMFFDCDGVIWLVVGAIPHTNEAVNLLKAAGKQCKFVSNNSVRSDAQYLEKFNKMGICNVVAEDIVHPAKAITRYAKTHCKENARYFSLCSDTANDYFRKNGMQIEELQITEYLDPTSLVEKIHLSGQHVDAVLFDINLNLNFAQIAKAALYLKQGDCDLIVGATDSYLPMTPNMTIIGFSFIENLLRTQNQSETIVLGKPSPVLGEILKDLYDIKDPKRVLFVGDSLKQDIVLGKKCGYQTLLVLTGTATKQDLLQAQDEQKPDYYADSLVDFLVFLNCPKEEN